MLNFFCAKKEPQIKVDGPIVDAIIVTLQQGDDVVDNITYKTSTGKVRTKGFIRDTVDVALKFFNWRCGHEIISVKAT